jgi:large subunit ribosomal protein L21
MMYAIIRTGGKQYRVQKDEELNVELLGDMEAGSEVTFSEVLMVGGETARVGRPLVEGVTVKAEVVAHGRDRKILVFKKKRRKGYRKKRGHRQSYTRVRITEISG